MAHRAFKGSSFASSLGRMIGALLVGLLWAVPVVPVGASPVSVIDPAAAALTVTDLGPGFAKSGEGRRDADGLHAYFAAFRAEDPAATAQLAAQGKGFLFLSWISVFTPGERQLPPEALDVGLTVSHTNLVNELKATDTVAVPGPAVGDGSRWLVSLVTSGETRLELVSVSFLAGGSHAVFSTLGRLPAVELARLAGIVASRLKAEVSPPGSVLLADNFDAPGSGHVLPTPRNAAFTYSYADGEYVFQKAALPASGDVTLTAYVNVPGLYGNASLAIDTRLAGDAPGSVSVGCRIQEGALGPGYQVRLDFPKQRFQVTASTPANTAGAAGGGASSVAERVLAEGDAPGLAPGGKAIRVELACVGNRIAAAINGQRIADVQDDTYAAGGFTLGLSGPSGAATEARFDNLVLTQR
jgi:hypothetical protein